MEGLLQGCDVHLQLIQEQEQIRGKEDALGDRIPSKMPANLDSIKQIRRKGAMTSSQERLFQGI